MRTIKIILIVLVALVTWGETQRYGGSYRICCHTKSWGLQCMDSNDNPKSVYLGRRNDNRNSQIWTLNPYGNDKYKISVETRRFGRQYLEAFPGVGGFKLRNEENTRDQVFEVGRWPGNDENAVRIVVETENGGYRIMEAFPFDGSVRPIIPPFVQEPDQRWVLFRT